MTFVSFYSLIIGSLVVFGVVRRWYYFIIPILSHITKIYHMSSLPYDNNPIWSTYKESDFIDAKDNQGDWRVGYIVTKYDHSQMYKIRFDGWSSKYD